jgi:hypothetical protein
MSLEKTNIATIEPQNALEIFTNQNAIIKSSGVQEEEAKAIVIAIAKGEIPNILIRY